MNNIIIKTINNQSDIAISANNDIEAIKTWLTEFEASINTFNSYKQCAERFVMWAIFKEKQLKDIRREDIAEYQAFLANPTPADKWCGAAVGRNNPRWKPFVKGLANASIRLNLQILTGMYEYLIQSGYLSINPFRLIKLKSAKLAVTNKSIERFLTQEQWQLLIKSIDRMTNNARIKWIFQLLYMSGCRRSEIINARMNDFIYKRDQWWLKVIGKGNKYGEIPVTEGLLKSLVEYRQSLGLPDYPTLSEDNIPLINSTKCKFATITDSMLYKIIKSTCKYIALELKSVNSDAAYIIEQVSTHWLRHTSATHQVDAGIDIRIVKENLRHSMLETTMRYQHTEKDKRHDQTIANFGRS